MARDTGYRVRACYFDLIAYRCLFSEPPPLPQPLHCVAILWTEKLKLLGAVSGRERESWMDGGDVRTGCRVN